MGDRANCVIFDRWDNTAPVWLYTHWAGHELASTVQTAMQRRQRWEDAPYLARIIFCEMVRGHEDGETGFGISTRMCDNEHKIIVVDCGKQEVRLHTERRDSNTQDAIGDVVSRWTFTDFVALSEGDLGTAYNGGED